MITNKVVLNCGTLCEYTAQTLYTDGSYHLSVKSEDFSYNDRTVAVKNIKKEVANHVAELHNVRVESISGVY